MTTFIERINNVVKMSDSAKADVEFILEEAQNHMVHRIGKIVDERAQQKAAILGGSGYHGVPVLFEAKEILEILASVTIRRS